MAGYTYYIRTMYQLVVWRQTLYLKCYNVEFNEILVMPSLDLVSSLMHNDKEGKGIPV